MSALPDAHIRLRYYQAGEKAQGKGRPNRKSGAQCHAEDDDRDDEQFPAPRMHYLVKQDRTNHRALTRTTAMIRRPSPFLLLYPGLLPRAGESRIRA